MDDLLDKRTVCRFFGGTKPIDQSTLWRGIKAGRYPKPIHVGPQVRRWKRSDCEAALRLLEYRFGDIGNVRTYERFTSAPVPPDPSEVVS